MGATKRVCELLVQIASQDTHSKSCFTIVRFGNVLGSSGSAIPHFLNQIKAGGPVTVTDKRVSRYFMTIPDAVSLVLKAIVLGNNGDLFVLKMGQPIRIYDLAVSLIRAHGLIPGKDIDIKLIGLFPGEKLSEELHHDELDILVDGFEDFSRYRHLKLESKEIVSEVDKMISLARDGSSKSLDLLEEISNSSFVKDHQKNEAA